MFEKKILYDNLLLAYLRLLSFSIYPIPQKDKVAFCVEGENLTDAINSFYSNPRVLLTDYCDSYRSIRSMVFTFGSLKNKTGGTGNG